MKGKEKNVLYLRDLSYRNGKLLNAGKSYFDPFRYLERGSCYTMTGLSISWVAFGNVKNQVHSSYPLKYNMICIFRTAIVSSSSSNITNITALYKGQ